jgi:hypothetical protein
MPDPYVPQVRLEPGHIEDLKLAAAKMRFEERRGFQAEMALKYCGGSPRQAEAVFGWSRHAVELGLHERRTGITCVGAQAGFCGNKLWEDKHPEVAEALWRLAESQSQQDPSFRAALSYTRLTAREALPSPSTMAEVLNRNGYRLRPVLKAKPQKKSRKPTPSSPTSGPRTGSRRTGAGSSG